MALDKVVDSAALDAGMALVADTIRAKAGTTDPLAWPDGFKAAVESITGGSPSVTDEIVTVAFSASNSDDAYHGLYGIIPSDSKYVVFVWCGSSSDAANNQLMVAFFQLFTESQFGRMLYTRWRNSNYDSQVNSASGYDLIINTGDEYRMVTIK